MTKSEIFDDVVSIMKNDSATCRDIAGADPAPFRERISEDMSSGDFIDLVNEYLHSFGLTGHLEFYPSKQEIKFPPFASKRYNDRLYAITAHKDSVFQAGDCISELDGMTIPEAVEKYSRYFNEKNPDRQSREFDTLIRQKISRVKVLHKATGVEETVDLEFFPARDDSIKSNTFYLEKPADDTALINLPDFLSRWPIENLIKENKRFLKKCRFIIFDVRGNRGGSDMNYYPFLKYVFPKGKNEYLFEDCGMDMLFTERNCKERIKAFEQSDTKGIEKFIKKEKENMGKGWVSGQDSFTTKIKGSKMPEKVFILTDERCGSSGDSFVSDMSVSPKVTVIGRRTSGITDYSNLVHVDYGDYSFYYPESRQRYLDKGIHYMGVGYPVDVEIPWTPEHFEHDADLEKAMELIENYRRGEH